MAEIVSTNIDDTLSHKWFYYRFLSPTNELEYNQFFYRQTKGLSRNVLIFSLIGSATALIFTLLLRINAILTYT